jgi:hypothetical protein
MPRVTSGQSVRFSFERPRAALGFSVGGAFKVGIGQVVERDGGGQSEQVPDAGKQRLLDGVAVTQQEVGDTVEPNQRHRLEVGVEQFAQRTAAAHPLPGAQFRTGGSHAADQAGGHGRALDPVEAEVLQNGGKADPADGGKTDGLDADRAGAGELQRRYVDLGEVGGGRRYGGVGTL